MMRPVVRVLPLAIVAAALFDPRVLIAQGRGPTAQPALRIVVGSRADLASFEERFGPLAPVHRDTLLRLLRAASLLRPPLQPQGVRIEITEFGPTVRGVARFGVLVPQSPALVRIPLAPTLCIHRIETDQRPLEVQHATPDAAFVALDRPGPWDIQVAWDMVPENAGEWLWIEWPWPGVGVEWIVPVQARPVVPPAVSVRRHGNAWAVTLPPGNMQGFAINLSGTSAHPPLPQPVGDVLTELTVLAPDRMRCRVRLQFHPFPASAPPNRPVRLVLGDHVVLRSHVAKGGTVVHQPGSRRVEFYPHGAAAEPQLELTGSVSVSGRATLPLTTVEGMFVRRRETTFRYAAPLGVLPEKLDGILLTTPPTATGPNNALTLRWIRSNGTATCRLVQTSHYARCSPEVRLHIGEQVSATCELRFEAGDAPLQQLRCLVPGGWEVAEVTACDETALGTWRTVPISNRALRLDIWLAMPLSEGERGCVQVVLRPSGTGETTPLPLIKPLGVLWAYGSCAVQTEPGYSLVLVSARAVERSVKALASESNEPAPLRLTYYAGSSGAFRVGQQQPAARVTLRCRVLVDPELLTVRYTVELPAPERSATWPVTLRWTAPAPEAVVTAADPRIAVQMTDRTLALRPRVLVRSSTQGGSPEQPVVVQLELRRRRSQLTAAPFLLPLNAPLADTLVTVELRDPAASMQPRGLVPTLSTSLARNGEVIVYRYASDRPLLRVQRMTAAEPTVRVLSRTATIVVHRDSVRVTWHWKLDVTRRAELTFRPPQSVRVLHAAVNGLPARRREGHTAGGTLSPGQNALELTVQQVRSGLAPAGVLLPELAVDGKPVPLGEPTLLRVVTPPGWRAVLYGADGNRVARWPGWHLVALVRRHLTQLRVYLRPPNALGQARTVPGTVRELLAQLPRPVIVDRYSLAFQAITPERRLVELGTATEPQSLEQMLRALQLALYDVEPCLLVTAMNETISVSDAPARDSAPRPLSDDFLRSACREAYLYGTDATGRFVRLDRWQGRTLAAARTVQGTSGGALYWSHTVAVRDPAALRILVLPYRRLSQVSMLVALSTLVLVTAVARRRGRLMQLLTSLLCAVLAAAAALMPAELAALFGAPVGAALAGLVLGRLRWPLARPTPDEEQLATTVVASPTARAGLMAGLVTWAILVLAGNGATWAQADGRGPQREPLPPLFVLQDAPWRFYVPASVLERWRQRYAEQAVLYRRGELRVELSPRTATVNGWIDVVVRTPGEVGVPLPLEGWSFSELQLDERPLVLEQSDGRVVARIGAGVHRLRFRAQSPVEVGIDGEQLSCHLSWLPALETTVTVLGPEGGGVLFTAPALRGQHLLYDQRTSPLPRTELRGHIGPLRALDVLWVRDADLALTTLRCDVDQLVVLYPQRVERYVVLTPASGSSGLLRLSCALPEGWTLETANGLCWERGGELELLAQPTRLDHGRLVIVLSRDGGLAAGTLGLAPLRSATGVFRARRLVVASFEQDPRELVTASEGLEAVSVDEAELDMLLDLAGLSPGSLRVAAWRATSASFQLQLAPSTPTIPPRRAQLSAEVTISQWGAQVTETIRFSNPLRAPFAVALPPPWRLQSVRTPDELRWSLATGGNLLLLQPNLKRAGTEQAADANGNGLRVTLEASVPAGEDRRYDLGRLLALPEAEIDSVELFVYRTPEVALSPMDTSRWRTLRVRRAEETRSLQQRVLEARYACEGPPPTLLLSYQPQSAITDWQAETTVVRAGPRLQATTSAELQGTWAAGSAMTLALPGSVALDAFEAEGGVIQLRALEPAGQPAQQRWALVPVTPARGSLRVRLTWSLRVTDYRQWPLEQIYLDGRPPSSHTIRVSREALPSGMTLAVAEEAVTVRDEADAVVLEWSREAPTAVQVELRRAPWAEAQIVLAERYTRRRGNELVDRWRLWLWAPFGGSCHFHSNGPAARWVLSVDGRLRSLSRTESGISFELAPAWALREVEVVRATTSRRDELPTALRLSVGGRELRSSYLWYLWAEPTGMQSRVQVVSWQRAEQYYAARLVRWAERFLDAQPPLRYPHHRLPLQQALAAAASLCRSASPRLRWLRNQSLWRGPLGTEVDAVRRSVPGLQDRFVELTELARQADLRLDSEPFENGQTAALPGSLPSTQALEASGARLLLVRRDANRAQPASARLTVRWLTPPNYRWQQAGLLSGAILVASAWLVAMRRLFYLRLACVAAAATVYSFLQAMGFWVTLGLALGTATILLLGLVELLIWWRTRSDRFGAGRGVMVLES